MNGPNKLILSVIITLFCSSSILPQYFGRNKVQYENFDFKVMDTENFRIYFYPSESEAITDAAKMLERWNIRLSKLLNHKLERIQPIIIYANHADFQQTNVISGLISQGTGGVTEGLKNRIVLPLTGIYKTSHHVLGHELVHAFQFDIMNKQSKRGQPFSARRMPLWFVEGMAEYYSIGQEDPLTEMWIRDAVLHEDIPTIKDVSSNPKYFPYRWGHAIWTYIGDRWGEKMISSIFREVLWKGWNKGFERIIGMKPDSLSREWSAHIKETYQPQLADRTEPQNVGQRLFEDDLGLNLAPAISPDGKYAAFISRRNVFTLNLYLANVQTGEVIKKLVSSNTDSHFDALRFMNSSGAWSPDGQKFAFVVFEDGDNQFAVLNVKSREIEGKIKIEGAEAILDLAWSPDGQSIVVSGIEGGISDLYLYNFETNATQRLTDDRYAQFQPSWSPDGQKIVFATDQGSKTDFEKLTFGPVQMGILDLESKDVQLISIDEATKHINPHFSPDGSNLFFIADPDGFSDIYAYSFETGEFSRITRIATGISGLTELSPAMTMAQNTGDLIFTVFDDTKYNVQILKADSIQPVLAPSQPMASQGGLTLTDKLLNNPTTGPPQNTSYSYDDYNPSLKLISIGRPSIGVAVDRFGAALGGSVSLLFSDMLGNHVLNVAAQANGGIRDLGGQALYLNRSNRINWGGIVGHIPFLTAQLRTGFTDVNGQVGRVQELIRQRVFIDRLSFISEYPLSTNRRFEFTTGYTRLSYHVEADRIVTVGGQIVEESTTELDAPNPLNLVQSSVAYVGDYSFFGFTSPANGKRFRFEAEPTFGGLQYLTVLADYRHYFFQNPITFAFRLYHNGRYLEDSESSRLTPLFVGYETMVRGYDIGSFNLGECSDTGDPSECPEIDRLIGSRIGVFNAEIRLPLFGNEQFGIVNFPFLPTELAAFFDGGVAWTKSQTPEFKFEEKSTERIPVFSTGIAARVNLFGYLVTQFYYAIPFQRPEKSGQFGFVIAPGW